MAALSAQSNLKALNRQFLGEFVSYLTKPNLSVEDRKAAQKVLSTLQQSLDVELRANRRSVLIKMLLLSYQQGVKAEAWIRQSDDLRLEPTIQNASPWMIVSQEEEKISSDLQDHICQFLPLESLAVAARVSRAWNHTAHSLASLHLRDLALQLQEMGCNLFDNLLIGIATNVYSALFQLTPCYSLLNCEDARHRTAYCLTRYFMQALKGPEGGRLEAFIRQSISSPTCARWVNHTFQSCLDVSQAVIKLHQGADAFLVSGLTKADLACEQFAMQLEVQSRLGEAAAVVDGLYNVRYVDGLYLDNVRESAQRAQSLRILNINPEWGARLTLFSFRRDFTLLRQTLEQWVCPLSSRLLKSTAERVEKTLHCLYDNTYAY